MNSKDLFRPYSSKSCEYTGSVFNIFYYYVYKYGISPNVFETKLTLKKETIEEVSKFSNLIFEHKVERKDSNDIVVKDTELVYEYEDCLVSFSLSRDSAVLNFMYDDIDDFDSGKKEEKVPQYFCRILYKNIKNLDKILGKFNRIEEKRRKNIFLLCKSTDGFYTRRFDVSLPKVDIDLHYNDGIKEKSEKIIQTLKKDRSGLLLFSGKPGTGKSTFVKYITSQIDKKIIYLPSTTAEHLTDPGFLDFVVDCKNSIFLLEDAEKVIRSRENSDNSAVSNILNVTDGILGDCLNIFIIATFNTSRDQIDKALLRKGRLLFEHHFDELTSEKCNKIFESLNINKKTDSPMSLADIFNFEDNYHKEEEKIKIGF
jgi:hypothetical protein